MDLAISTTGFVLIVARLININPPSQSWRFKEGMSSSYSQWVGKSSKRQFPILSPGTNLVVGLPVQSLGIMPASTIIRYRFALLTHQSHYNYLFYGEAVFSQVVMLPVNPHVSCSRARRQQCPHRRANIYLISGNVIIAGQCLFMPSNEEGGIT